ncbi:MAG: EVE domain-containing protein [Myxococcales bacterium]|nr:EVE domain-containing protein [Myxococcales bacterium]
MADVPSRPACWLLKTEPDTFSIDDLRNDGRAPWDGVRNFSARNRLREMEVGELVLVYHSSTRPTGVVGLGRVCRTAYPDPSQFDPKSPYFDPKSSSEAPRWSMIDVEYVSHLPSMVTLDEIKGEPALADMVLLRRARLSVQPVTWPQLRRIVAMGGGTVPELDTAPKKAAGTPAADEPAATKKTATKKTATKKAR